MFEPRRRSKMIQATCLKGSPKTFAVESVSFSQNLHSQEPDESELDKTTFIFLEPPHHLNRYIPWLYTIYQHMAHFVIYTYIYHESQPVGWA